jgi:alpha-beta hydrolase superfamily lysophospholipase
MPQSLGRSPRAQLSQPELERLFSGERLSTYIAYCGGDFATAVEMYRWNAAIPAAFWGPVGHLEVVLRNTLDNRLAARHHRHGLIIRLHLGRPILVGHSYGGTISVAFAERHPDEVHGLVLVDAAATCTRNSTLDRDQAWVHSNRLCSPVHACARGTRRARGMKREATDPSQVSSRTAADAIDQLPRKLVGSSRSTASTVRVRRP